MRARLAWTDRRPAPTRRPTTPPPRLPARRTRTPGTLCFSTETQVFFRFGRYLQGMETLTSGIRRTAGTRARLPFVLPSLSGVRLNGAEVGRLLGVSQPTARAYLRTLEQIGLVTPVPFFGGGRRTLRIAWEDPSPRASLLHALQATRPGCRFYWWKRTRTKVVDLIADLGRERIGFCCSIAPRPKHRDWQPLVLAIRHGVISRGFLLHPGNHAYRHQFMPIFGLPLECFMERIEDWMFTWRAPGETWQAMVRVNRAASGFP